MEEQMKRKRELLGEGSIEKEEKKIFKRSNKMVRSPMKGEQNEEMIKLIRGLAVEMREGMREEIKEMAREQKEFVKIEMERMREQIKGRKE